jgi:hypothetical protein
MSRDLTSATITNISEATVYPFFAIELNFDSEILRLWTGQGTLTLPDTTQWIGTGTLLDISAIEETAEMAVRGATLTLSGIPSEILSLALSEPYQGRVCNIYFGTFTGGDLTTAPSNFDQIFSGYMDQMNIQDGPETATIELKVENKLVDLERARVARFTSGYQKSIYPSDKGLDFVESLQDRELFWGRNAVN